MRTITTTKTVFTFDELSDKAKDKAIDKLYDINVYDEWWDNASEDAENIGIEITAFDINRRYYCDIKFIDSASEVACKIRQEHGEQCETFKTASNFLTAWDALVEKYSDGVNVCIVAEDNQYEFDQDADDLEEDFKKAVSDDYLQILRNEYEYLTSEEAIRETIEANQYEFDEEGNLS